MTQQSSVSRLPTGSRRRRAGDAHRSRVVQAEMRRLQRRLLAYGPMPRKKLEECCGAERWREGTFEEAVRAGVEAGKLKQLPLGWIEATALDGQEARPQ